MSITSKLANMADIMEKMRTCVIKGKVSRGSHLGEHDNAIAEAIAGRIEPKPELVEVTPRGVKEVLRGCISESPVSFWVVL